MPTFSIKPPATDAKSLDFPTVHELLRCFISLYCLSLVKCYLFLAQILTMEYEQVPGPTLCVVILRPKVRQFVQYGLRVRVAELNALLHVICDAHVTVPANPMVVQADLRGRNLMPADRLGCYLETLAPLFVIFLGHPERSLDCKREVLQLLRPALPSQ